MGNITVSLFWIVLVLFLTQTFAFTVPYYLSSSRSQMTTSLGAAPPTNVLGKPLDQPYGSWKSDITSQAITAGSVRLGGVRVCDGGELYWLEGRPQEQGRYVLCRYQNDKGTVDVTPPSSNVRTRVHEYGGGAVVMGSSGKDIFVSEFATQSLYRVVPGTSDAESSSSLEPISPDDEIGRYRYADGVYDEKTNTIYCVREDHGEGGTASPKDVVNEIVAINSQNGETTTLASGNDFYSAPRLSPDGKKLAYVTWNHPNMPWDATELQTISLDNLDCAPKTIAGGILGDDSIMQPLWHPSSGDLYYLSDESGYYNLYKATESTLNPVLPLPYDFGGAAPGWMLGQQGYTFLSDGRLVATYQKDGKSVLLVATLETDESNGLVVTTKREEYGMKDGLPMMFDGVQPSSDGNLYFIGGSPSTPTSIYKWNLEKKVAAEILVCSSTLSFDEGIISVPRQVEFPTTGNRTAFGYFYEPKNKDYISTTDKAPPLLVKVHGGPTACAGTSFNPSIQFWTSRGFAILDVDYGGSTGYGREYRRRLRDSWGIVDVDDVCAGAQYLAEQNLVDGERLCIDGGSAGGYTTLAALAFRKVFKAGCSLYGVGDLGALAGDTHKFESRYLDGLVGPYPEKKAIYEERSPIESVDTLSCPILLLQGVEDKIVPPNQAQKMHEALLKKGIPTCLKLYEGEQHGFRKAENIQDALDSELAFYGRVFGIDVPGAISLEIDNM